MNYPSSNTTGATKTETALADLTVVGGAGHVGIPLVLSFAEAGMTVNINDLNESALASLRAGKLPFIEHGAAPLLTKALANNRLVFTVGDAERQPLQHVMLSLSPFRRIVKDYFLICDSYYQAIKTQPAAKIEAIDMGRRGLHDEGSQLLKERLKGKIAVDIATARRLFTLLCALHWKG